MHAHVNGLKAPFLLVSSSPREGQPPAKLFVPLAGLDGRLGRLPRPVPVHASIN